MIAIIDYDAGNIRSVEKALLSLGEEPLITRDREEVLRADKVILPGVGAFGDAMHSLQKYGMDRVLHEVVERKIPLLGICLGMQLLFERSEETPAWHSEGGNPQTAGDGRPKDSSYGMEYPGTAESGETVCGTSGGAFCLLCAFLLFKGGE